MIHSHFFFFWFSDSCSLVCPEQLNCLLFFRKNLEVPQIIWFSSIFVYLNPFQQWLSDFEIHLLTQRTEALICNYYRRFKRSLMNTKLALIWKEDFGPLGNSPVLLLLSSGKTPLMTTVAKFLDTPVCGGSWCLTQPQSIPCEVHPNSWIILLDNPHKAAFSRLVVHLFLPHFFLPLKFLLTCLDTALCEQPASLAMNVCELTLLVKGVNDCLLDNCQLSSLPHDCVA